jgi:YVTN family beta-propeller protein
VEGRIDHLSVDVKGKRLFVAALGNNSVEVLDLATGKKIQSIKNLKEPQGLRFIPETNQLFAACGGDGTCRIYDGRSLQLVGTINLGDDADNVRYDTKTKRVYVGYGDGALAVIDAEKRTKVGDIPLPGHPESFQLETEGSRIFVNVPKTKQIVVIDRARSKIVATWPIKEAKENFPMTIDEVHRRLFVGCRKPAKLLTLDMATGETLTSLDCCGDTDDVFHDADTEWVYVSCGEGFIDVFAHKSTDHYQLSDHIPTAAGARTSLFVPELGALYLAVPHRGSQPAEIRAYKTK